MPPPFDDIPSTRAGPRSRRHRAACTGPRPRASALVNPPGPGSAPRVVAVVMAAGLGTRMKSRTPKLLHPLAGRPMVAYVVDAGRQATGRRPIVVTSPATAAVRDAVDDVDFVLQAEPRGTGDAVAAAVAALPADADEILVLTGDAPLLEAHLLAELLDERRLDQA